MKVEEFRVLVGHLRPDEIGKMYEFIQLGEEAALEPRQRENRQEDGHDDERRATTLENFHSMRRKFVCPRAARRVAMRAFTASW